MVESKYPNWPLYYMYIQGIKGLQLLASQSLNCPGLMRTRVATPLPRRITFPPTVNSQCRPYSFRAEATQKRPFRRLTILAPMGFELAT